MYEDIASFLILLKKIVALIPARSVSKGVPDKNIRKLGVVIGEFKRLKGSWTEMGRKTQLKHTSHGIDETLKAIHTNRLASKIGRGTVYDTVGLYIYQINSMKTIVYLLKYHPKLTFC